MCVGGGISSREKIYIILRTFIFLTNIFETIDFFLSLGKPQKKLLQ